MKNELKKLTAKQLIELIKTFEHYPAVTLKDGKDYILSYLEDESCTISKKEIAEYLLKSGVEITQENIHLYYEFMSDEQKNQHRSFISDFMANRALKTSPDVLEEFNFLVDIGDYKRESINKKTLQIILFGVKDTLKPIEEYIAEIKESEAYKSYVANSAKVS